jgi:hypothetical protein
VAGTVVVAVRTASLALLSASNIKSIATGDKCAEAVPGGAVPASAGAVGAVSSSDLALLSAGDIVTVSALGCRAAALAVRVPTRVAGAGDGVAVVICCLAFFMGGNEDIVSTLDCVAVLVPHCVPPRQALAPLTVRPFGLTVLVAREERVDTVPTNGWLALGIAPGTRDTVRNA